jgi:hypothetical protein
VAGLLRYLKEHARPGETVAITYEDLPVALYTDLRVVGGLTGQDLTPGRTAEWIVLRHHVLGEVDGAVAADLQRHVAWQDYERIELEAPDTIFDNREAIFDPLVGLIQLRHPFRTPTDAPRVVIFHRIR